jgi:hypothetical protein
MDKRGYAIRTRVLVLPSYVTADAAPGEAWEASRPEASLHERHRHTLQDSDGQLVVENLPWVGRPAVDGLRQPDNAALKSTFCLVEGNAVRFHRPIGNP